jgi:hypothetical protein
VSDEKPRQLETGVFFCVDAYGFRSSIVALAARSRLHPCQRVLVAGPGEARP